MRTLLAVAGLAFALPRPGAAQGDTTARRIVFNEVFPGPQAFVVLEEGSAYLVEVEPNQAVVTIRFARQPGRPPQVLTPLTDRTTAAQGITYLLIVRQTAEYRVEAFETGRDPVRVRIVYDPQETARWVRMRGATAHLPRAGFSVRATYLSPFGVPTLPNDSQRTADAFGWQLCLGVVARGAWTGGALGGCALALESYDRGPAGRMLALGVAPHIVTSEPSSRTEVSVAFSGWVATTTGVREETYWMFGLGLGVTRPVIGERVRLDLLGGFRVVATDAPGYAKSSSWIPLHAAAGLQLRL